MQDCTPPNPASAPMKDRRNRWLVQGSSMAIAFGLCFGAASEAQAQRDPTSVLVGAREDVTRAAQGNFTATPAATITRSANRDVVSVNTTAAILNWTTLDIATLDSTTDFINFLPAGTTLAFEGPGSEFTVLNRIFGTPNAAGQYRGIAMSGTVTSNLSTGGPVGGNIWFYAPGGIFLGNGAAFNVGSLILTASDLDTINTSDITFNGATDPFAKVIIGEGANITLPNEASTFLVVAPTIEQRGTVNVNGSVLYFITDTANIDIDTSTGEILDWGGLDTNGIPNDREGRAELGNYILHTGVTTGPASNQVVDINGAVLTADPHEIIFDARNNPLEMYLSGQIGYQAAGAAALGPNGEVILEATFNGLVEFGATQFSSQVTSDVVRTRFNLQAGETFSVLGDGYADYGLDLVAASLFLDIPENATFSVAGDFNLSQLFPSSETMLNVNGRLRRTPMVIELASGSQFSVGGNFNIDNSAGSNSIGGVAGTEGQFDSDNIVQGGDILISTATGSSFSVGGNFLLDTSVTAGAVGGVVFGADAGDIFFDSNGTFTVGGSLTFNAGANPLLAGATTGGFARSGRVDLYFSGTSTLNDVIINNSTIATGSSYGGDPNADLDATSLGATISFYGGTHTWNSLTIDGSSVGGQGAGGQTGGQGFGTDVGFYLYGDSQVTIPTITIDGSGTGGQGGYGAAGGPGRGGYGRMVVGSNATLGVTDLTVAMDGVGGAGGSANFSFTNGGVGGNGYGGYFYTYLNSTIVGLQNLSITATGTGGTGAPGYYGSGTYPGGNGGNAFGGTVEVNLYGTGTTLQGLTSLTLDVTGTGGAGAAGVGGFSSGEVGADGGNGTGGSLSVSANTGALLDLSVVDSLSADGIGGAGGTGGAYYGGALAGGNGGTGYGGTLNLTARGGTITGGDIDLSASGIGGAAGTGGYYYGPVGPYYGADGASGGGTGGTVRLRALEGSPGVISLGAVSIDASGILGGTTIVPTTGGSIILEDASTSAGGNISMTSLTATALGSGSAGTFTASSTSGPISVTNDVTVNVSGDILFDFTDDGQLVAGGATTLTAGGNIALTHTTNTLPVFSIDTGGAFTATAGGNFTIDTGGIVNAGGIANVRAEGDIFVDDIRGVTNVILSAGGNNTVNDATVTGPPTTIFVGDRDVAFSGLFIIAGSDNGTTPIYDPTANATITGTLTSTGRVQVTAGGSAFFRSGSSTLSDNALFVSTGDDIIIESGASLAAALNPSDTPATDPFTDPANLRLEAGSITALSSPITSPIASLVIAGSVDANDFGLVLSGNAIDARGSTLAASSIQADINDAPTLGSAQSDDNGLLTDPCLEGDICLGAISADNRVWIGQNSNNGVLSLLVESGTVAADSILVTTLEDIVFGTSGITSTFGAATEFVVESLTGDVNLVDAAITSDRIAITAAGSLLGSASLTSANDIGITVGADLNADAIDTGGQLTTVAGIGGGLELVYTVPGSIAVGALTQDALTAANFTAGGDISFGSITTQNQAIVLTANSGSAFLGTTTQAGAASVDISALDVSFNDLAASGAISLTATAGGITGTTTGSLTAGGGIGLDAATDLAVGALSAGEDIALLAGGTIDFASATAAQGGITMTAGGAITGGDVTTTDAALATDDVTINAGGLLTLGTIVSGEGMTLAGTGVVAGALAAQNGAVSVDAGTGSADLGFVSATGAIDITGNAVTLAGASGDLGLTLTATGGDLIATGDLTSGAGAVLTAAGLVDVTSLSAGDAISVTSAGFASDLVDAGTDLTILSSGAVVIGGATTGGAADITGTSISLGTSTIGTDLLLDATGGDLNLTGDTSVANNASLTATGAIVSAGNLTSGNDMTIDAGGDIAFGIANAQGTLSITGGGDLSAFVLTGGAFIGSGDLLVDVAGAINADRLFSFNSTGDSSIAGGSITVNQFGRFSGSVAFTSTVGGIDLTGFDFFGTTTLQSAAGVRLADITAQDGLGVDAATDVLFDTLAIDGGDLSILAGGDVTGNQAIVNGGAGTFGSLLIDAGGAVVLTGNTVGRSGVQISGASVTANRLVSNLGDVSVDATGLLDIAQVSAGQGRIDLTGSSVAIDFATHATGLAITATTGDIVSTGNLNGNLGAGDTVLDAAGNIAVALVSNNGAITMDAGGDIGFAEVYSRDGSIAITAGGSIAGSNVVTDDSFGVGGIDSVTLIAGGDVTLDNSSNVFNSYSGAADDFTVQAGGAVSLVGLETGGMADLTGTSVDLGTSTIGGDLLVDATGGNASLAGITSIGGSATIGAAGNILLGTIDVQGGALSADAGGAITFTSVTSVGDASLLATGDVSGGDISAGGAVDIAAANVAIGDAFGANGLFIDAAGDVGFGVLTTDNNNVEVTAGGSVTGTSAFARAVAGDGGLDRVIMDAGGDITLTGTVQSVFDGVFLTAGGAIDIAAIDAHDNLSVAAGGALTVDDIVQRTGGFSVDLSGTVVTLGTLDSVAAVTIDATTAAIIGTASSGNAFTVNSGGDVTFGTITTDNGNAQITAAGSIAGGDIAALAVGGDGGLDRVILDAGGDITLTGTAQSVFDGIFLTAGGAIDAAILDANDNLILDAGGVIRVGSAFQRSSGFAASFSGSSVFIETADAVSDLSLLARVGDITTDGLLASDGAVSLIANIDINMLSVTAGSGIFASAGDDARFAILRTADGPIRIDAGDFIGAVRVETLAPAGDAGDDGVYLNAGGLVLLTDTSTVSDDFVVSTSGEVALHTIQAGGNIVITGQTISSRLLQAGGDMTLDALGGDIVASGTNIAGGAIQLSATGDIGFDAFEAQGGQFLANAGGAISFGSLDAAGAAALFAGGDIAGTTLAAGGDIAISGANILLGSATAGGDFDASTGANGALQVTQLAAGGAVSADVGTGGIVFNVLTAASGDLLTSGDLVIEEADIAGLLALEAASAFVRSSGALDMAALATAGDLDVATGGDLSGTFTAAQDILLDAGGALALSAATAGRDIALASGATLSIAGDAIALRNLAAASGDDVVLAAGGTMQAGNSLTVDAANALRTGGLLTGVTIGVTAGDVAIDTAAGGRIGDASITQLITLTSNGTPVVLGGGDAPDAFSLSQAEIDAIHSGGDLVVNGPSILVRDTAVQVATGSDAADDGTIGVGGTLALNSASDIRIEGMLSMNGAGADNTLALGAANLLHIETSAGGISMLDSDGELAGSVTIAAADFIAATDAALEDIADMSLAEIEARLAQNDGVLRPDGVIQTGDLVIATDGGPILVQNTGAGTDFDERRGFSVNSLTVSYGGGTNVPVVLNGIIAGATGLDAIALADIPAGFDPGSTFNGCLIGNVASCLPVIEEPRIRFEQEIQSLIEERILGGEDSSFSGGEDGPGDELGIDSMLIGMAEQQEFERDPLIDEPVTGAGNEDLWNAFTECEDEDSGDPLCVAEEREPAE